MVSNVGVAILTLQWKGCFNTRGLNRPFKTSKFSAKLHLIPYIHRTSVSENLSSYVDISLRLKIYTKEMMTYITWEITA